MKLLKKLMAGAMAIAMLSAYTVAFANSLTATTSGSTATISGAGIYAGKGEGVFSVTLPTAAANNALAFIVDPQKVLKNSPPSGAAAGSTYGTVVFQTTSGSATTYKDESAPLRVTNMSSMDVTVNMFASLSDTKMTLATTSGFSAAKEHLYLGVKVATVSGGTVTPKDTKALSALGAKDATVLATVPHNFTTSTTSGGLQTTMSGSILATDNSWKSVEYTVVGASNASADWKIAGIAAPTLTIKWVVDKCNDDTLRPLTTPTGKTFTAQIDKDEYKGGETVTLLVKPNAADAKLTSAKLTYIALKAADGTMDSEKTVSFSVASTPVNGVYTATLTLPTDMALSNSPAGAVDKYVAPVWEIDAG